MAEREPRGCRGRGRGRPHSVGRRNVSISPRRGATHVVQKTVRDIVGAQYLMLTHTNYGEWTVLMKVMLKAKARGMPASATSASTY